MHRRSEPEILALDVLHRKEVEPVDLTDVVRPSVGVCDLPAIQPSPCFQVECLHSPTSQAMSGEALREVMRAYPRASPRRNPTVGRRRLAPTSRRGAFFP